MNARRANVKSVPEAPDSGNGAKPLAVIQDKDNMETIKVMAEIQNDLNKDNIQASYSGHGAKPLAVIQDKDNTETIEVMAEIQNDHMDFET